MNNTKPASSNEYHAKRMAWTIADVGPWWEKYIPIPFLFVMLDTFHLPMSQPVLKMGN